MASRLFLTALPDERFPQLGDFQFDAAISPLSLLLEPGAIFCIEDGKLVLRVSSRVFATGDPVSTSVVKYLQLPDDWRMLLDFDTFGVESLRSRYRSSRGN